MPHVCNYASRWKVTLCARLVEDGKRYCWQHAPKKRRLVYGKGVWTGPK